MRYVVKTIADLPTPLEGYTVTDISKAYQSIDGTEVLLKLARPPEEDESTLDHAEMLALLQTAAWKVEDPAHGL